MGSAAGKRLRNDLFCVKLDVKPQLNHNLANQLTTVSAWHILTTYFSYILQPPEVSQCMQLRQDNCLQMTVLLTFVTFARFTLCAVFNGCGLSAV